MKESKKFTVLYEDSLNYYFEINLREYRSSISNTINNEAHYIPVLGYSSESSNSIRVKNSSTIGNNLKSSRTQKDQVLQIHKCVGIFKVHFEKFFKDKVPMKQVFETVQKVQCTRWR